MDNDNTQINNQEQPVQELAGARSAISKTTKQLAAVMGFLLTVGVAVFFVMGSPSNNGGQGTFGSSFSPFVPIWLAIFVPLIGKNKGERTMSDKKVLIIFSAISTTILLLGLMFFLARTME